MLIYTHNNTLARSSLLANSYTHVHSHAIALKVRNSEVKPQHDTIKNTDSPRASSSTRPFSTLDTVTQMYDVLNLGVSLPLTNFSRRSGPSHNGDNNSSDNRQSTRSEKFLGEVSIARPVPMWVSPSSPWPCDPPGRSRSRPYTRRERVE